MSVNKPYKLTQEELDLAEEILSHEGWSTLMKIIETHVEDIEDQIHKIQPTSKECGTILIIERSKAVGAKNLLHRIKNLKAKKS